jgi:hypothetical protein
MALAIYLIQAKIIGNIMSRYKIIDGINIQWPWSELLASGKKIIETRSYALPERLRGVELAIIETPGKNGKRDAGIKSARIIGTIIFEKCYRYRSRGHWLKDRRKHCVPPDNSLFGFNYEKEKWGWVVKKVEKLDMPVPPPAKRGIIFAKNCKLVLK